MKLSLDVPRIEAIKVENYRALHKLEMKNLTPMTVLLGPNGSGKSTVFDVFSFLSECFQFNLRQAWDRRGRGRELKTRGSDGPIVIELKYRENPESPVMTYHLAIDDGARGPEVREEWLQWRRGTRGQPFRFLDFRNGRGGAVSGEAPDAEERRSDASLNSPDSLAVSTLGQLAAHPRIAALRRFVTDWYVSYLSIDQMRGQPETGPQERLSRNGDNLANVVQYLKEQQPECLEQIFRVLQKRIPQLDYVMADVMADGRLLLQIKDLPFNEPILAKFSSDGTLKMLAYLTVLHAQEPSSFIGLEEPENFLHPRLLPELAEECRFASQHSQILLTSHSPFLLNAMKPEEVRILYRDNKGFTQAKRVSDIPNIQCLIDEGAALGDLWLEGNFGFGDPLTNSGGLQSSKG